MGEQQIVSPQEAAVWASPGWRSPINAAFAEQLLHTVATEPDRIRVAMEQAWEEGREAEFRAGGRHVQPPNPYRAATIKKGADL